MEIEIPKEAYQPRPEMPLELIGDIDRWYCPDCGATGEGFDTVEHLNYSQSKWDPSPTNNQDRITLACPECYEMHIYVTTLKNT